MKASWASLHIGTEEFLIRSKNNLDFAQTLATGVWPAGLKGGLHS